MTKCIIEACTSPSAPALKRGLCMRCHSRAKKMVQGGTTTWDEIVALGLALPLDTTDPFTSALESARRDTDQEGTTDAERDG